MRSRSESSLRILPILALASTLAFALSSSVLAGEGFHGDWPGKKHSAMGGCASKDKVARMKELHGDKLFHQTPDDMAADSADKQTPVFVEPPAEELNKHNLERFI